MKTNTLTLMFFLVGCGGDATISTFGGSNNEQKVNGTSSKSGSGSSGGTTGSSGSSTGSSGSSTSGSGGAIAGGGSCSTSGPQKLDVQQLAAGTDTRLGPGDLVSQTLTVGKSGQLSEVEVNVFYCNLNDTHAAISLEVFDASGRALAQASISAATMPQSCSASPLSATQVGPAHFDLSTACLKVTAGERLTIALSSENVTAGSCDVNNNVCTSGRTGQRCFEDADCASADLRAGLGFNPYPAGDATVDHVEESVYDLSFKTFIR